ncbi:MAG: tail fiber domain-containing protein [Saprospiraceae bacterium]
MKRFNLLIFVGLLACLLALPAQGQIGINTDGTPADASAILDITSTTRGLLAPRMTEAERDLISMPTLGLLLYKTDATMVNPAGFYFWNGASWQLLNDQLTGNINLPPRKNYLTFSDFINRGGLCVGGDCFTSKPYGRLNLRGKNGRIDFDDTSTSSGFPPNDWAIQFNDIDGMGSKNAFYLKDVTHNQTPFAVEANAGDHAIFVDAGGNVGFGTNTPGEKLEVNGNIQVDGNITATGTINTVSDARLKTQVEDLQDQAQQLEKLMPVIYQYRQDKATGDLHLPAGDQFGLIAQELQKIYPELVQANLDTGDGSGEKYLTINYSALIPILIQTMQEQQAQIDALNQQINESGQKLKLARTIDGQIDLLKAELGKQGDNYEHLLSQLMAIMNR